MLLKWLLVAAFVLLWNTPIEAACPGYDSVVRPTTPTTIPRYYQCDTEAELPSSSVNPGDRAYTIDTNKSWVRGAASWGELGGGAAPGSIPAGVIVFTAGACPTGFTEYTAAQGFAIVGLPSGGTAEGTVGTAWTNLQDKGVAPAFAGAALGAHTHQTLAAATFAGNALGTHQHTSLAVTKNSATSGNCAATNIAAGTGATTACKAAAPNLVVTAQLGTATATSANSAGTPAGTVVGIASASSANSAGTPAGTVATVSTSNLMAYIQLRACSKD